MLDTRGAAELFGALGQLLERVVVTDVTGVVKCHIAHRIAWARDAFEVVVTST